MVLVSESQADYEHLPDASISGSVSGSILGGRWSDRTLARLKAANGGSSFPEVTHYLQLSLTPRLTQFFADAPREYKNRHGVVTSFCDWICLGMPRTGQRRCDMCDAFPRRIFIHVCFFRFTPSFALIRDRWIYTSTLAYIVDANTGRSSTAVATNSSFRGLSAFVAAEIAVPLQVSQCHNSLWNIGSKVGLG